MTSFSRPPAIRRAIMVWGLTASMGAAWAGDRFPFPWPDDTRPRAELTKGAQWSLEQAWPDTLGRANGFVPLRWEREAWRAPEHGQGDMPSIRFLNGNRVRLTAGGRWAGRAFLKIPVIAYRAPAAGYYGLAGRVSVQLFSGQAAPVLRVFHRTAETLREETAITLTGPFPMSLGRLAIELKAGEELVLAVVVPADNTAANVDIEGLEVGMDLADKAMMAERMAMKPGTTVANPTPQQLRVANQAVSNEGIVFPAEANVLNVRAFGAAGDGIHDDTDALQAAYNHSGLIYLPNGTYLITRQIKAPPRRGSAPSRRVLQGQSRDGVILKLQNGAPGFGDPANPRAVLVTSYGVAQAFRNAVRDLTIDVGSRNPGAIALDYFASNQGAIENVRLRSSDPEGVGAIGLVLRGDNGPLLVKNLEVIGFDVGIDAAANQLATFENLRLSNQLLCGIQSRNKTFIRGLKSRNHVPALRTSGQAVVLLDAVLESPSTTDLEAVNVEGMAFIRNLRISGYAHAIRQGETLIPGPVVDEWTSIPPVAFGAPPARSMNLPVRETPDVDWAPCEQWTSLTTFNPEIVTVIHRGTWKKENWAPALQQAIDQSPHTVYFPVGRTYEMTGEVHLRGRVRRLIGCEVAPTPIPTRPGPTIYVDAGDAPVVVIERFDSMYSQLKIVHRSPRTLVIKNMTVDHLIVEQGAGDLYLEDAIVTYLDIHGGRVWARQLNQETGYDPAQEPQPRPNTWNLGGTLWLFGLKTEANRTKIWTREGGRSEIWAYILANFADNPQPMFTVEESDMSLTVVESVIRNAPFRIKVRRISSGMVQDYTHEVAPKIGLGAAVPLVTTYRGPTSIAEPGPAASSEKSE